MGAQMGNVFVDCTFHIHGADAEALDQLGAKIMTKVDEAVSAATAATDAQFERMDQGIVGIKADLDGLKAALADQPISADAQAKLDALVAKVTARADAVAALDAENT